MRIHLQVQCTEKIMHTECLEWTDVKHVTRRKTVQTLHSKVIIKHLSNFNVQKGAEQSLNQNSNCRAPLAELKHSQTVQFFMIPSVLNQWIVISILY